VLTDVRRIADVCDLPLLVDADTGFGSAFNIARTVKSLIKLGAGAMHIEDQVQAKRCGHRPGKEIVSKDEMVDRIKAAADARVRERLRSLEERAAGLRAKIAERAREAPVFGRRSAPSSKASGVASLNASLAAVERRIRSTRDDLEERARQDGALPGWLR